MENFITILGFILTPISAAAGWFAGKRKQNNDFLQELQASIDILSTKNTELVKQAAELNTPVILLKKENAALRSKVEELKKKLKGMPVFALLFLSLCLSSCATKKSFIEHKSDTVFISKDNYKVRFDSIYIRESDSVMIRTINDTTFVTRYKSNYFAYVKNDTVIKSDTIYISKNLTTEKQAVKSNSLSVWLQIIGLAAIFILIIFLILKIK
jgi:hypothetical protein